MYSSPGRRSLSLEGKEVTPELFPDEVLPLMDFMSFVSLPIGRPISAAELVRRPLALVEVVARLNICGKRALERDEEVEPSGGWIC